MPSSLTGLNRVLTWRDFPRQQEDAPGEGEVVSAAYTDTSYNISGISVQPLRRTGPTQFRLADSVVVRVTFNRRGSHVKSWLFSESQEFQDDMLNHEQGHYKITALVARDYFVDVMLLRAQTFETAQDGIDAVEQIQRDTVDKIGAIHTLYDAEVHPEQESGQSRGRVQQRWDGYFNTAVTQDRAPATQDADGRPNKIKLIDVLANNGKRV